MTPIGKTSSLQHAHPDRWWRLSDDLLCVVGPTGTFATVNGAWERTLGWVEADLLGTRPLPLIHPDDLPRVLDAHRSAQLLDRFEGVEVRCRAADGRYRRVLWSGFRDDGCWYGTGKDVTDVMLKGGAATQRESHSQALLRAFPDGLCVFGAEGQVIEVNARLCEMIGFKESELLGVRPPLPVWPEAGQQRYADAFEAAMREGRGHFELPLVRADGSSFPAVIDVAGLSDADGSQLPGFLCVIRDVTDEAFERAWLRQAHEVARLTSWDWDPASPHAPLGAGFVGFAPLGLEDEITIDHVLEALRPPYADRLQAALDSAVRDRAESTLEYPLPSPDGTEAWVETRVRPQEDSSGAVVRVRATTQDITARKLAELARAKSEVRLRRAQRMARVGDFEIDPFDGAVTWSDELYRLFDVERGEFSNRLADTYRFLPAEDAHKMRELGKATIADGEPRQFEHRYLRGDKTRWAETRIEPLDLDGGCRGLHGTMQDITDRKRAEIEAHLRARLLDAVDVAVVALDTEMRVTHWNVGAERLYGWTADDVMGRPVPDFATTVENRMVWEQTQAELPEKGGYEHEVEITRKDGTVVPIYLRGTVFMGPDGREAGVVAVGVDITERIESERRLRAARDYLHRITDSMGEGLFTLDEAGRLVYLNRAGEELLGWSQAELVGKVMHDAVHHQRLDGSPYPREACPLLGVAESGEVVRVEDDVLIRKDGNALPVEMTAAPFETEDGVRGSVVVFSDISVRKRDELRMREQLESLSWVGRVRDALAEDRFVLHAQPIVDLATNDVVQHELLLRMCDSDGGLVAPTKFLPVAEEYGLIADVDRWVVAQAMELAGEGHAVELNLSAHSIAVPGLIDYFKRELDRSGVDPSLLVVELTETALVQDETAAELFIERIGALGCKLALDDFGTGYGGFSYLKRLPVDYLKIDREFVRDLLHNDASHHVVEAIVSLARGFGQKTIAEGVEDEETVALLRQLGVDFAQGFVIGKPMPTSEALVARPA